MSAGRKEEIMRRAKVRISSEPASPGLALQDSLNDKSKHSVTCAREGRVFFAIDNLILGEGYRRLP